jgi:Sortase domain
MPPRSPGPPRHRACGRRPPARRLVARRRLRGRIARRPAAAAAAACGLLICAAAIAGLLVASQGGRPALAAGRTPFVAVPDGRSASLPDAAHPVTVAAPVALLMPAIGVRTSLIRLGRSASGALQVPRTTAVAGWYTGSPRPGEIGAAVIAGHVDSYLGPGVFFRLRLLRHGNLILVRRADGSLVAFRVLQVRLYLKTRFPTAEVYGPAPAAELRVVTCGGTFDPATGSYLSNVVVSAIEVSWHHRATAATAATGRKLANIAS